MNPLTPIQYEHHNEQMEAARRDFDLLWREELLPAILSLNLAIQTDRDFAFVQHMCWLAFTRGKGLQ